MVGVQSFATRKKAQGMNPNLVPLKQNYLFRYRTCLISAFTFSATLVGNGA